MGAPYPMGAPGPLQLWRQHRAKGACRGQPAPSRQAQGGQSPAVSLNAPFCARQRGGRAWLSLGSGTLLGWGLCGLWQARTRLGHPVGTLPLPHQPKIHPLACPQVGWGETPTGHLCKCCQGFVVANCTPRQWGTAPGPQHCSLPQFPTGRKAEGPAGVLARCGMGGDTTVTTPFPPKGAPRRPSSDVTWP